MPYSPEHKAETRARIVTSARKLFNRRGFTEVSIDEIMGVAGLTRGGFYNHFATKDELYAEAIVQALQCEKTGPDGKTFDFAKPPGEIAQEIIAAYLSDQHFQDIEESCSLIALPSDTARSGEPVKQAYQHVLKAMIALFQASQGDHPRARQCAVAIATLCVGGMVLARAVDDAVLSDEIREAAMGTALETGGWDVKASAAAAE